eukprot:Skav218475  [mRNA]  locus=scaffold538:1070980:1071489:- [translate_table: standard]
MASTISGVCGVAIMVGKFSAHGIDLPLGQVGRGLQVQALEATIHNATSASMEVCSICGSCCMTIEETSRTAAGVLVLH